jgi:hypothetical protein
MNSFTSRAATGPSCLFRTLLAGQAILALITLVWGLLAWQNNPESPTHVFVSVGFSLAITLLDWAWFAKVAHWAGRLATGPDTTGYRPFDQTLMRTQTLAASLIYHSAALPFLWLIKRAAILLTARSYFLIQMALLLMGLIPVLSIAYLDRLQPPVRH